MNKLELKKGQTYICTKSDKRWWTVGKEYPVFLDSDNEPAIRDDDGDDWHSGYLSASNNQFKLKEEQPKVKLDEPQKPVVPKFVAEWIEQAKKERQSLYEAMYNIESSTYYHKYDNATYQWMFEGALHDEHQELFAEAYMHGYEVEKEPLYTVTLSLDLKYYLVIDEYECDRISPTLTTTSNVLGYRYYLTEKEIKSADNNLWPFAVPVEEAVEG